MIAHWYGAGLSYRGFFNRDQDTLSLAYAQANMDKHRLDTLPYAERENPPFALAEKVFEITYRAHLTPWLVVAPDVQYLIDPGVYSFQPHPNALLFGLQTQISL
ncbi:carbohydrate-selective porin [Lasius niger]|uniref:Carbohydrate-selective porin n=1 Tax=Lasius niger TaxID=67767 RepID=A0A0J7JUD4_LASNI|nr:carbohydrate-selective porin [Lasius niger]